jgi:hypothetical protein
MKGASSNVETVFSGAADLLADFHSEHRNIIIETV